MIRSGARKMNPENTAKSYLQNIPASLSEPLLAAFNQIVKNFRERRWEPAELNGGKLCEVVYSIVRGHVENKFPDKPEKPRNMVDACRALEAENKRVGRSICVQIPRVLVALYEVRSNRGVGHVGGDVDPNHMDAVLVLSMAKWLMAELIRIFHGIETSEATQAVESLIDRTIPIVWKVAGRDRVLIPSLSMKEKVLAILFVNPAPLVDAYLLRSVEYSNPTVFRREVLVPLHCAKLIEYDEETKLVYLSPLGIRFVEDNIPLQV
jgi:hypothetical protein